MVYVLIALFVVLPILELFVFVQVAGWIGFLPAVALIVAFSVGGAWLVKYEGIGVLRRAQQQLDQGELPATELVNGLLLLVAGALMVVPGFLTDIAGLLLLLPPTRALVRLLLMRRFEKRRSAAGSPAPACSPARPATATSRGRPRSAPKAARGTCTRVSSTCTKRRPTAPPARPARRAPPGPRTPLNGPGPPRRP